MLIHISIWLVLLLIRPLLSAPPSLPPPPAPSSCPPNSGDRRRELRCFTSFVETPNPADCYRILATLISGNTTIDNAPLRVSNMRGVQGTYMLPWSWVQPTCILLLDTASTVTVANPLVNQNDRAIVETLSLMEIAETAQRIMQRCVIGGPRLGGKTTVGEYGEVDLYVGRPPEKGKGEQTTPPVDVAPFANMDLPTLTLDFCAGSS